MRTTVRALLALSLLLGFYVLVFAAVAVDLAMLVTLVLNPSDQGRVFGVPTSVGVPVAASGPLLAAVAYGLFAVSRSDAPIAGSVRLTRDKASELWETVEELAEQVGTRPPTEIRLIGDANAMVSEESYLLGLLPGTARLLYVGAPLLVGLRADELRAVLCHELGHYARKHTRLAAIVYRGSASLQATLTRLFEAGGGGRRWRLGGYSAVLYVLLARYARLYQRLALAVNRRQELEADAAAARIVGADAVGEALRAVHALAVSWEMFDGQILTPMRRSGRLPDDPFSAYQAMLEDPRHRDAFARLRDDVPQEPDKPLDSHPSLANRLRTLSRLPSTTDDRDRRPALSLLTEYQDSFKRVRSGPRRVSPTPLPWREWLTLAAETRAVAPARALKRVVARLAAETEPGTVAVTQAANSPIAAALRQLENGQGRSLARRLDDALGAAQSGAYGHEDSGTVRDGRAAADEDDESGWLMVALFSLVGQALVGIGVATWHLSWTGSGVLITRGFTADELIGLLAGAVRDPLEVPRLRLHLASLGLDENAPVALGSDPLSSDLYIKPLVDTAAKRRQRAMAVASAVALAGLWLLIYVVANSSLAKREQASYAALKQPDSYANAYSTPYDSDPSALPTAGLNLPVPRMSLPGAPLYLLRPLPRITVLPIWSTSTVLVRSGDTLTSIAHDCDTTVAELQRVNDMGSSTRIYAGQKLKVPAVEAFLAHDCG